MSQKSLHLPHGTLRLPVFLPDATDGVVRSLDADDLEQCGIEGLVMNTFHLMQRPGSTTVRALGGLHRMSGWSHPIVTDSGGFQAYSVVRANPKAGRLSDSGVSFQPEGSPRKYQLTPEKAVQLQLSYGSDVVVCLDDCTHVDDPRDVHERSVERTLKWALRGKKEFDRLTARRDPPESRPLLMAVIQGGGHPDLRRRCAEGLLAAGFAAFGFGGWPLDGEHHLLEDILAYTRDLVPAEMPLHALGIGHPRHVVACVRLGYDIFDSAMPTRDARHGRLYAFTGEPRSVPFEDAWFHYVYAGDDKYIKADRPISPYCDALCCRRYSIGYLHHLYEIQEGLYRRLATIHNLRFMTQLMARLGDADGGGEEA
ncbi:MAG: tRNA-ribosyltransferase family protein [Anaerolineae bacterium]